MNVPGIVNYSKETVGLRQSDKIQNQQFKLIYAYPLIFADVISPQLRDACRKFQTVSYLREIIVNNSLNIITAAANANPDYAQQNNVAQLIGNALLTGGSSNTNTTYQPVTNQSINTYELQRRVQEKTQLIKKYLETDPRTKKLMPAIEIITLKNLIDVPLIVGTKGFTVSSQSMLYILAIAVVTQTPMDKISNIENIIRKLKTTKEEDWFRLLTSLTKNNKSFRERQIESFKTNYPGLRSSLQLNKLTNWLLKGFEGNARETGVNKLLGLHISKDKAGEQKDLAAKQEPNTKELNNIFNILKLTKNTLDDTLLNFKFVLDPVMLKNQIGLDTSNNTMETTVTKFSTGQKQVFMKMYDKFMELIATPGSLFLNSAFNTLYPSPTVNLNPNPQNPDQYLPTNTNINFLELKEKHFDVKLSGNIKKLIFDTFSKEISNSLGSISPDEAKEKVSLVKSVCESMDQVDSIMMLEINDFTRNSILRSTNFSEDELNGFTEGITRLANNFGSMNKRFENVFSQLVNNSASLLKLVQIEIYTNLENFFREITDRPNYTPMMTYLFGTEIDKVKRIYIPQITDTLFIIFYFFFLYRLQAAICSLVVDIDLELDSKINDVFEFPNYTLVLPLDIISGIQSAHMANNFEQLISGSDVSVISSLNDNYVKGMVKFLVKRLRIPSIMVFDDKKKEIWYQFMFMTAPEKMSLQTLDSFIKST